jgi:predicted Zn-dependent peptidase
MSSRLFQRVREQLGAAYYVKASADLSSDHGFFSVASGVEHQKLEIVISAILEELSKTAHDFVPEAELARAKDHLTGRLLLGLETSDAMATYYGGQEVLCQPIVTPTDLAQKIASVTAQEIRDVAAFIFKDEKLNLAVIGPLEDPDALSRLLHFA